MLVNREEGACAARDECAVVIGEALMQCLSG